MAERTGLGWRFISAGVLVPILLLTIFVLPPWSLLMLTTLAAAAAGWEALGIVAPSPAVVDPVERWLGTVVSAAVVVGISIGAVHAPLALWVLFPAVFLLTMFLVVLRPRDIETFSHRAAALAFVPLYVGGGLAVFPVFRYLVPHGDRWVLLIMMLTFFSDTAAYFAGRFLGSHKLHPRLSPKKTWEGSIGGILGSGLALILARLWYLPGLEWLDVAILAPVAGAIGQAGDLFESALKRSVGVKDSGTLLPGHGGMLDRIDALLPTAMFVVGYALVRGFAAG